MKSKRCYDTNFDVTGVTVSFHKEKVKLTVRGSSVFSDWVGHGSDKSSFVSTGAIVTSRWDIFDNQLAYNEDR